jgi:predicted phosphoadenosine phosphosulfate sulfurtransferase
MNTYEAARKRLEVIFNDFDNIYVSFSGGKDSGVMLNMVIQYMREKNITKKISVFHIDYEAQYQMTTDYVNQVLEENKDLVDVYRCCLPVMVTCCTSAYTDHWIPWDEDKKEIWVRPMPGNGINEHNHSFDFFKKGMWDYDFQELFSTWIHKKNNAKKTACLVGIRTDESLNRWRAIHSDKNQNKYNGYAWTLEMSKDVYNCYPIYDMSVEDIWVANAKFEFSYNKLYDLYWKAGLTPAQMRVASPFISTAIESLKLYKVIDPNNWGKLVGRVNGVNFAGLYGGTTAMGWRSIKLPKGHTWKSYMEFLLSTLPKATSDNYRKKLETSQEFWRTTGGCLSSEVIQKLKDHKVDFTFGPPTNRHTDKKPVIMEYLDDIDIEEFKEIPTYKRMCVCIMKNDHLCKFMGFGLNKLELELRSDAEQKYKNTTGGKKL